MEAHIHETNSPRATRMAKTKKTAAELAALIRNLLREPELRVAVYSDQTGWCAKVYASDSEAAALRARVNRAVERLQREYELAG